MVIVYDTLPDSGKALVDCYAIARKVGFNIQHCISHIDNEINETDLALTNESNLSVSNQLLDYRVRLVNAKKSFNAHFKDKS